MEKLLNKIMNYILKEFPQIKSISFVPQSKIHSTALTYRDGKSYHILCANDVETEVMIFNLLHEVGHLHLDYLSFTPRQTWSHNIETKIHLWAVKLIGKWTTVEFESGLAQAFSISEEMGFNYLKRNLSNKRRL